MAASKTKDTQRVKFYVKRNQIFLDQNPYIDSKQQYKAGHIQPCWISACSTENISEFTSESSLQKNSSTVSCNNEENQWRCCSVNKRSL